MTHSTGLTFHANLYAGHNMDREASHKLAQLQREAHSVEELAEEVATFIVALMKKEGYTTSSSVVDQIFHSVLLPPLRFDSF